LELLSAYLQKINSSSIIIHIIFEFSEILIILKRNLIEKINSFKFDYDLLDENENENENDDSQRKSKSQIFDKEIFQEKIPIKILEFLGIFLNFLSILIIKSNLSKMILIKF
jgi:hypothetical protein